MGILIPSEGGGSLGELVYIGGVAYFNRSTKPTERSAGVALVAGDRWYKTNDGTEWFWNGTYWLSGQYVITTGRYGSYSTTQTATAAIFRAEPVFPQADILLVGGKISQSGMAPSGTDYWTGQIGYHAGLAGSFVGLGSVGVLSSTAGNAGTTPFSFSTALLSGASARLLGIELIKVLSPANILVSAEYYYHFIAP